MSLFQIGSTGVFERLQAGRQAILGSHRRCLISTATSLRHRRTIIQHAESTISDQVDTAKDKDPGQKVRKRRTKTKIKEGFCVSSTGSHGGIVKSNRLVDAEKSSIEIDVTECGADAEVDVLWGVYRASPDIWQYPKAIQAPESCMDEAMNAMSTKMRYKNGVHSASLSVPMGLAPLTFAYVLVIRNENDTIITPTKGAYFATQIGVEPGSAKKLGVMPVKQARKMGGVEVNFAVECQGCEYVSLVLVKCTKEGYAQQEIVLDPRLNRTGTIWHCALPHSDDLVGYGWRVNGDLSWETNHRISPDKIVLDPEASSVVFVAQEHSESLSGFPVIKTRQGEEKTALSGIDITPNEPAFKSTTSTTGYGILSIDTRSFGQGLSDVKHPGTFLGIAEAAPYFASLGIAAINIKFPYTVGGPQSRTVSFFAPDPSLASTNNAAEEFKSMTHTLHAIGINVIISLDLTFTAEGSDEDPHVISWRGLDYGNYYRENGVLNCGKPIFQEHIMRALRHWMLDLGVGGFEFVYAENMVQNMDDVVMDAPALPDALCHDPVLSGCMMIASPCNSQLLPRDGARGFPHWGRWMEAHGNDSSIIQYYATPSTSMNPSVVEKCALFMSGQAELFSSAHHNAPGNLATRRPIPYSINAIDGDAWVSSDSLISTAASAARAAMIADGVDSCLVTADSLTRAILATAIFSSGTPCIPHEALSNDIEKFVGECLTCRPVLSHLLDGRAHGTWHAAHGAHMSWEAMDIHVLGRLLSTDSGSIYIVLNPEYRPIDIHLPTVSGTWHKIVDSYSGEVQPAGIPVATSTQTIAAKSIRVFTSSTSVA